MNTIPALARHSSKADRADSGEGGGGDSRKMEKRDVTLQIRSENRHYSGFHMAKKRQHKARCQQRACQQKTP